MPFAERTTDRLVALLDGASNEYRSHRRKAACSGDAVAGETNDEMSPLLRAVAEAIELATEDSLLQAEDVQGHRAG